MARQAGSLRPSAQTAEMLGGLYDSACAATALAVRALRDGDARAAEEVVSLREKVDGQVRDLLERQTARLRPDDADYLVLARLQMSLVDKLSRVYRLASRAARSLLPTDVDAR